MPQMGRELVEVPNVVSPVHGGAAHALSLFRVPVVEYISPVPAVVSSHVPVVGSIAPAPAVVFSHSTVKESTAPAPAMSESPAPVQKYVSPTPAVFQAPAPVVENIAPAPAVIHSPAPVVQYNSAAPTVFHMPALVMEYSLPVPAVFHAPTGLPARARAEVHVVGLQGSVQGQSSSAHRGHEEAVARCLAHRRLLQWHVHGWFAGIVLLALFVRPKMLGITAGMVPRGVQKIWVYWEMDLLVSVHSAMLGLQGYTLCISPRMLLDFTHSA